VNKSDIKNVDSYLRFAHSDEETNVAVKRLGFDGAGFWVWD